MTTITLKTHPTPQILHADIAVTTEAKGSLVYDVIAYIMSEIPRLMNSGLSGYSMIIPEAPASIPIPGFPKDAAGFLGGCILQDVQGPETVRRMLKPINNTIEDRWPGKVSFTVTTEKFASFADWFSVHYDQGAGGGNFYLVSRLIGEKTLSSDPEKLISAIKSASKATGFVGAYMIAGKGVQEAKSPNAVHPAWRTAYLHTRKTQPPSPSTYATTNSYRESLWQRLSSL